MRSSERAEFGEVMRDAREAIGQGEPYTEGGLDLMFAALAEYDLRIIQQALVDHINSPDGKWRPNASYIQTQIQRRADVQWISADEAWARIPMQENEPGLLNQVTAQALAVAAPFLNQPRPELNAARMAFRACYDRLVEQEKLNRRTPQYWVSPAGSIEAQEQVKQEGVRLGLLPGVWTPSAPLLEHDTAGQAKVLSHIANLRALTAPKGDGND